MFVLLKLFHLSGLILREHVGKHPVDTHLFRDHRRRIGVVARDHGHLNAKRLELLYGRLACRLYGVGRRHQRGQRTVHRDVHQRSALRCELLRISLRRRCIDIVFSHQLHVAREHTFALYHRVDAAPRHRFKALRLDQRNAPLLRALQYRAGDRVLRAAFGGGC